MSNVSSEGLWAVVYEASGKMDAVVITRVSQVSVLPFPVQTFPFIQTGIIEKEVVVVEGIVKSVYASNSLVVVSTKTVQHQP